MAILLHKHIKIESGNIPATYMRGIKRTEFSSADCCRVAGRCCPFQPWMSHPGGYSQDRRFVDDPGTLFHKHVVLFLGFTFHVESYALKHQPHEVYLHSHLHCIHRQAERLKGNPTLRRPGGCSRISVQGNLEVRPGRTDGGMTDAGLPRNKQ